MPTAIPSVCIFWLPRFSPTATEHKHFIHPTFLETLSYVQYTVKIYKLPMLRACLPFDAQSPIDQAKLLPSPQKTYQLSARYPSSPNAIYLSTDQIPLPTTTTCI